MVRYKTSHYGVFSFLHICIYFIDYMFVACAIAYMQKNTCNFVNIWYNIHKEKAYPKGVYI